MAAGRPCATAHGTCPVGGPLSTLRRSLGAGLVGLALAACGVATADQPPAMMVPSAAEPGDQDPETVRFDQGSLDQQTQLGLSVLHARGAARLLGSSCAVRCPPGPVTFGDRLALAIEIRNPFPEPVELLLPEDGYGLEFRFKVRRAFPGGGEERTSQTRVARLDQAIRLGPGQSYRREMDFDLDQGDQLSALWQLELGLSMRIAGLKVGERSLPLSEFELRPARLLALPQGWQELAEAPLAKLEQAAGLDSPLADRHLLVCAALLPEADRDAAVRVLAEALPRSPSTERAVTIAVALERLTGLGLGASPQRWIEWWESRQNERP